MSLAVLYSRGRTGINAPLVTVEVHLANALPSLSIVGLPEMAVKESKDRVRGALLTAGFEFPRYRITINLAPADLPKESGRFDLPIALGILAASKQVDMSQLQQYEFAGELALSGALRPIEGVLPIALATKKSKRALIIPTENAAEASLVSDLEIRPASHLLSVCAHLNNQESLPCYQLTNDQQPSVSQPDLADVRGQAQAKRALEVAAAGGHSLLFFGPPGTGKSMLANRLPSILPPMTEDEALETAAIISISRHRFHPERWRQRPFRNPHHTASAVALVGGGSNPRPGEISLAHNGVLFLDELPEFDRKVLEVLREPLESGRITISRANQQAEFPACFQLIAAMNPCPCGYLGDESGRCRCKPDQVKQYRSRISGPLMDRIDLHLEVPRIAPDLLVHAKADAETSQTVRTRVIAARQQQLQRCQTANHALSPQQIEQSCQLDSAGQQLLQQAFVRLGLSARGYHRVLKVARSIADLAGSDQIKTPHLSEAIHYRRLDWKPATLA